MYSANYLYKAGIGVNYNFMDMKNLLSMEIFGEKNASHCMAVRDLL